MKNPRELILERHRPAEEKLKTISAKELAELAATQTNPQTSLAHWFALSGRNFWEQAILPWRKVWVGIAAVWIGIVTLNFATGDGSARMTTDKMTVNRQVMGALAEQQRWIEQSLDLGTTMAPAPAPESAPKIPGPRSDLRDELGVG